MKTKLFIFIMFFCFAELSGNAQSRLWGTCRTGGTTGQGTIFVANADGSGLHTVYNFINATGAFPLGNLCLANNGKFYGVTQGGGIGDKPGVADDGINIEFRCIAARRIQCPQQILGVDHADDILRIAAP